MTLAVALGFGALIGVLLGLLGGGGSILAVPALVYAVGLDMRQAIPISLLVVGVASAVGAMPRIRAGQVQWRLAAVFAVAGIPATLNGSWNTDTASPCTAVEQAVPSSTEQAATVAPTSRRRPMALPSAASRD